MAKEITIIENDIKSFQQPMEAEMTKAIKHLENELIKIRTGRAHTSLIEELPVTVYGQPATPLKNIASLAAPESRLITIQPWDPSIIPNIEKAITASDLGLAPVNDGAIIRLNLPEMSSSRREELLKILGKKIEEAKMVVRNIRKDFNNLLRDAKKDKEISENFYNRLTDTLQKVTDKFIGTIEQMGKKKEKDITTV